MNCEPSTQTENQGSSETPSHPRFWEVVIRNRCGRREAPALGPTGMRTPQQDRIEGPVSMEAAASHAAMETLFGCAIQANTRQIHPAGGRGRPQEVSSAASRTKA